MSHLKLLSFCSLFFTSITSSIHAKDNSIEVYRNAYLEEISKTPRESNVWSRSFLDKNPKIEKMMVAYQKGELCPEFKYLYNWPRSVNSLRHYLPHKGFDCTEAPLRVTSDPKDTRLLRIDGTHTQDANETRLAMQITCVSKNNQCSMRIKPNGIPGSKFEKQPSAVASILTNPKSPAYYSNEAFKISWSTGNPAPKAPKAKYGVGCPFLESQSCEIWSWLMMEDVHMKINR